MRHRVRSVEPAVPAGRHPNSAATSTTVILDAPAGTHLPRQLAARWDESHPGQRLTVVRPERNSRPRVAIWDGRGAPDVAQLEEDLNALLEELTA